MEAAGERYYIFYIPIRQTTLYVKTMKLKPLIHFHIYGHK